MTGPNGGNLTTSEDAAVEASERGKNGTFPGVCRAVQEKVKARVEGFRRAYERTLEEAWKLGEALREAKEKIPHGLWLPWLEDEIGLPPRSAQRFMQFHKAYPEMRHVSHFASLAAAMRDLPPKPKPADGNRHARSGTAATTSAETATAATGAPPREPADEAGHANAGAVETTSVEAKPAATVEAPLAREPADEAGHVSADAVATAPVEAKPAATVEAPLAREPADEAGLASADAIGATSVEVTAPTASAALSTPESTGEAERVDTDDTFSAEATPTTTNAILPTGESVDEVDPASTGTGGAPYAVTAETADAVRTANMETDRRDNTTVKTAGEDLATMATRLELLVEGTPASAARQREADLRALSKLARVAVEGIVRHLDPTAGREMNADVLPDQLVTELSEIVETINKRRRGAKSTFDSMRGWFR